MLKRTFIKLSKIIAVAILVVMAIAILYVWVVLKT